MLVASSFVILAVVLAGTFSTRAGQATAGPVMHTVEQGQITQTGPNVSKVIDTYCSGCHNGRMRSPSGILLDQFDAARISASPDVWSRVYRQLHAGTMPPVGAARPDRATYDAVLASLEHALRAKAEPPAA